jgi:amino acid transporter
VLGSPLDKLLVIAVLTSAAASTQTTILPTARTSLSMAFKGAAPKRFGSIHPRYLTPSTSTIWMGVLSIAWYVGLTIVSEDILFDSIAALGLMIAFYYGITGFACPIYYRRELFKSARNAIMVGLAPLLGGLILAWVFIKSCIDLANPENSESGDSWFGLGPPLIIGVGFLLFGVLLMFLQQRANPEFFRRRPEAVGLVAGSGVEAKAAVVDARPVDGLLALAAEHQARMIVVGTHGELPIMGVVLGSTAYKLLHRSPVPVLVVRVPDPPS